MYRKWTKESIAAEIIGLYEAGENLSYSNIARSNITLLRASARYFGTWESAIGFAVLDYDQIRRYKSWSRERIIEKIKELHEKGADLSWRNVSINLDPQLAAAATKKSHFGSWREALESAGLEYDAIRKYRDWDQERILRMVRDLYNRRAGLNAKNVEQEDTALITAARRRFESWHQTLSAAGLDYRFIVQRAPFKRGLGRGQNRKSNMMQNG